MSTIFETYLTELRRNDSLAKAHDETLKELKEEEKYIEKEVSIERIKRLDERIANIRKAESELEASDNYIENITKDIFRYLDNFPMIESVFIPGKQGGMSANVLHFDKAKRTIEVLSR